MSLDQLSYEVKIVGKRIILAPGLTMLGIILVALLMHSQKADPARLLLALPEILLPLVSGTIVGTIIALDPALELQLTMPRNYPATGLWRVGLIFLCMACCSLLFISGMDVLHLLSMPMFMQSWSSVLRFLAIQMIWFPPLLWCTAAGFCIALLMQSRSAAGGVLGGIWVAEIVFKDLIWYFSWLRPFFLFPMTLVAFPATSIPYADYIDAGIKTRLGTFGIALILSLAGWFLLHNAERMLKGATEE